MTTTPRCALLAAACLLLLGVPGLGCGSGPTQIEGTGQDRVVSMGLDLDNVRQVAADLTDQMLADGFLGDYPAPTAMTVSRFENKTNLPNFPKETVLTRIRQKLRSSGQVKLISTYGAGDVTDATSFDTGALRDDPFFDADQVPQPGQGSVARLSVVAQLLYLNQQAGRSEQRNYSLRLLVTDVATGDVVFEGLSDDISKKRTKGLLG